MRRGRHAAITTKEMEESHMRKNFGAKPWTYPQPVFIVATYNEDGTPDAMNAAWGGICDDTRITM